MNENLNAAASEREDAGLNIKDLLFLYLSKWRWFVLSVVVCLAFGVLYLLRTPAVYTRTATLLIEDNDKGASVASDMNIADLGLFQSNTNVNNELIAINSPALMQEVVTRLNLTMTYKARGRFHDVVLYGTSLPVNVTLGDLPQGQSANFEMSIDADGTVCLSEFETWIDGRKVSYEEDVTGDMSQPLTTPLGSIVVTPTAFYTRGNAYEMMVSKSSTYSTAMSYSARLNATLLKKEATVISLSLEDVSVQRANDVINTLISVYNESWVRAKNQIAVSTSAFIDDRLRVIEQELGVVEGDISSYKSSNLISDLQSASDMYLQQSSQLNAEIIAINNSLYMARYIKEYVLNDANRHQLLPAGASLEGSGIDQQISEYNTILLQRNNLAANSSESNPLVTDMDKSLGAMREAIVGSLENHTIMLQTQLSALQGQERQATERIASTPDQAKYLLSVERQQKVKEALYLFLLQKREENELSQAFTAYNTRVITPPSGSSAPTSPKRNMILMVALALGFAIPMAVFFLIETSNTKLRGRKDLESLSAPFIGEVPMYDGKKKGIGLKVPKLHKGKVSNDVQLIVKEGRRDVMNEAFRVVRTNLEFMYSCGESSRVICVTSFNPGSGKTFISANIAMSLAVKGSRVIVLDGDLRRASLSTLVQSPERGLSDYLAGKVADYRSLIVQGGHENFSVLPVGTTPPNPTELLLDERLGTLMNALKSEYDYVFIDCPPVNIVADTQIVSKLADRTVFVLRAGLLERSMLGELETMSREERLPHLCVLLNGTTSKGGYYGYRYGYQYGYNYGYNYYSQS